jgi:hypothetical protein
VTFIFHTFGCFYGLAVARAQFVTELVAAVHSLDSISAVGGVNLQFNLSPVPQIVSNSGV